MDLVKRLKFIREDLTEDGVINNASAWAHTLDEAIAALQPGGERKWPDTICNDIDKLLRQHIRWTQGDHSEGIYIEGWRKAARAVEEYIQKTQRAPAPVAVTWQPIASAPKDGTPIAFRNRVTTIGACRWWTAEQLAEDEAGSPEEYSGGWYNADDKDDEVCPTEWMPLPSAALAAEVG